MPTTQPQLKASRSAQPIASRAPSLPPPDSHLSAARDLVTSPVVARDKKAKRNMLMSVIVTAGFSAARSSELERRPTHTVSTMDMRGAARKTASAGPANRRRSVVDGTFEPFESPPEAIACTTSGLVVRRRVTLQSRSFAKECGAESGDRGISKALTARAPPSSSKAFIDRLVVSLSALRHLKSQLLDIGPR